MIFNLMYGLILLSSYCTSSIGNFFTAGPQAWFPIVVLASIMIMSIVAMIYIISPLIGRTDIRVWARAKVYDAIITIIFAIIFLSFSTAICTINPVPSLASFGIVPDACNPGTANPGQYTPNPAGTPGVTSSVSDMYGLSICDLYQFNQNVVSFSEAVFWFAVPFGLAPQITLPFTTLQSINQGKGSGGIGISVPINVLPIIVVHQYVVPYMQVYFTAVILSQIQQILLSSSMFIFTIFMVIGLIARSFGVTKSFGGAMIAFGLGLGIIYPIMVTMSYGFMDTAIQNAASVPGYPHVTLANVPQFLVTGIEGLITAFLSSLFRGVQNGLAQLLYPVVIYGGFIAAGLVIIPMLNLLIVDAFIVDFSRAIGERMDLFSMLTRLI